MSEDGPDITEAIAMLRGKLLDAGHSIQSACDLVGVSRQSFYGLARPRGGSNLGPNQLRALCEVGKLTDAETLEVLVAWLLNRFKVGAASGPLKVAFRAIDSLPKKRRDAILVEMIDAYEWRLGSTRSSD